MPLPSPCRLAPAIALCTLLLAGAALAGPVPGVESFTKRAVEFPTSPSMEVWEIGEDDYLVTFKWKPESPITKPSVAGAFNNWDRADLPMEGPNADGFYTVTARIASGDYHYKFTAAPDLWFTDPLNPEKIPDGFSGHNSVLRLGITALVRDAKASKGDGSIMEKAILHRPEEHTYFDVYTPEDAIIRVRTLANDVERVSLILVAQDGATHSVTMAHAAGDSMFDFHEYHHRRGAGGGGIVPIAYRFELVDGSTTLAPPRTYPLILDRARIIKTPEWAAHAVWYQILIDRFRDGDPTNNPEHTVGTGRFPTTHPWTSDFLHLPGRGAVSTVELFSDDSNKDGVPDIWQRLYGGDFQGVIDKLDYLKSLGVNAIYFNPMFEAVGHHKYNGKTYQFADDGYGVPGEYAKSLETNDDFDQSTWKANKSDELFFRLLAEAKKRSIRVIVDGVFNHLGDDAPSFLDVKEKGRASRYADWYEIKSWEPFEHVGWAGFAGLPQFAKSDTRGLASDTLREHIMGITRKWMDPNGDGDPSDGIDGWRLDVPFEVPKPFWVEWCKEVRRINPDAYIVGEVWDPAEQWLDGDTFDAVMNYPFAKIAFRYFGNEKDKITATEFDRELARHRIRYSRSVTMVLQNLYDSHDTDRWVSRLMHPDRAYDGGNRIQDEGTQYDNGRPSDVHYRRLRLMALFQATYLGAPMIWYGTEIGMYAGDDPICRNPMWWEDLGSFDNPDYRIDAELRDYFTALFKMRNAHEVLRTGDFTSYLVDDGKDLYGFVRHAPDSDELIVVVLNNSSAPQVAPLLPAWAKELGFGSPKLLIGKGNAIEADGSMRLEPVSGAAIRFVK